MAQKTPGSGKPTRRKSDLTLLGKSTQELDDKVYTLEFGVNLSQITFEGLNNYSVTISCLDKQDNHSESLSSALEIRLRDRNNILSIEGGPPYAFAVGKGTLDLKSMAIDPGIIAAVNKGIAWLKGDIDDKWLAKNRRRIPEKLIHDPLAVNLLMSSISTVIGEAMTCHERVMREQRPVFTSKSDYVDSMFNYLKTSIDELTEIAIYRAVNHLVGPA